MIEAESKLPTVTEDLSWLVSPNNSKDFVREYWGRLPLRISRSDPEYYSHLLPETDLEFTLYLAARTRAAVEILSEVQKPQRAHSHAHAVQAFRAGKSLRIDGIQRFSLPITTLCRNLEQIISCPVNVNMYLSPGSGVKALKRHFDTHDVFVLQVHGNKTWRLYDAPHPFPLEFLPLMRRESVREMKQFRLGMDQSDRASRTLTDEFTMVPGDLLYLPRGFWHEAESKSGQISCHLTVGIRPTIYLELLNVALSRAAKSDVRLREPLPFGFGTNSSAGQEVATRVAAILADLAQNVDAAAAFGDMAANFLRTHHAGFENDLLRLKDTADDLTESSHVRIRKGVICGINTGTSPANLIFGSKTFEITPPYQQACEFIVSVGCFTVSELPGNLTTTEKLALVRQLIDAELLIVPPSENPLTPTRKQDRNWIPIRLEVQSKTIQWLDLGDRALSEPFLHQTVKRYRAENPVAKVRKTTLRALDKLPEGLTPSGMIFHISRCGSTLVANGLRAVPETIVISEPQPIGSALEALFLEKTTKIGGTQEQADYEGLLRGLINAYGQRRNDSESAFVLKFSSWNILHIATIRQLFPAVPCLIVVRDPVEVAVSCLEGPTGWMRWQKNHELTHSILGVDVQAVPQMTATEFCARMLGKFLESASDAVRSGCHMLDYSELTRTHIEGVAHLFGIEITPVAREAIQASLAIYSKDPQRKRPFIVDTGEKQIRATDTIREEIEKWAGDHYRHLRKAEAGKPLSENI